MPARNQSLDQLSFELTQLSGYHTCFHSAERPGYSGVAVYTKENPLAIEKELGLAQFDREGRGLVLKFLDFTLINLYIPHGGRGKENLG